MGRHILYAYVEGSDLQDVSEVLIKRLSRFVEETPWINRAPWVVNQRHENDPTLGPGDLPDWELGLNLELPDPGGEPPDWFRDVERIATFLGKLHLETARTFVIGIADSQHGLSQDLLSVSSGDLDMGLLRANIGG